MHTTISHIVLFSTSNTNNPWNSLASMAAINSLVVRNINAPFALKLPAAHNGTGVGESDDDGPREAMVDQKSPNSG